MEYTILLNLRKGKHQVVQLVGNKKIFEEDLIKNVLISKHIAIYFDIFSMKFPQFWFFSNFKLLNYLQIKKKKLVVVLNY